ncbi:MAG: carbohydrate ABC transporter permease [Alphaproteobacteria bacterium]
MTRIWTFLSRTQGRNGPNWVDWLAYGYLALGLLVILFPVLWLGLNSFKSQALLEQNDLSLIPKDYVRLGRASVTTPEGKEFVLIEGLPNWVLDWGGLTDSEKIEQDVLGLVEQYQGVEAIALSSYLGLSEARARMVIQELNLDDCLLSYASSTPEARVACDADTALYQISDLEDRAAVGGFLGLPEYKVGKISGQIRVSAPDPVSGEERIWAITSLTSNRETIAARALDNPSERPVQLPISSIVSSASLDLRWENYIDPLKGNISGVNINFMQCFTNSLLVTVLATALTLLINSMAAFALSKYRFRGQLLSLALVLGTLMVPPTVMLIGVFKMINAAGLGGSIWGVIIPGAATPTGVFLLRQYMLTIPEELLEAARMDAASEWKVFWRIIIPLAMPAIAALGILSVIWRWNDLILPLVAIPTQTDAHTLQLCLLNLDGENINQPHYKLAMTMLTLIPTTLVFVFLQRFITTGIASTGVK